jgi:hypothetical protein
MKLALALLSVAASALADSAHSPLKRVHHAHVARDMGLKSEIQDLSKRESFTGTATWYDGTYNLKSPNPQILKYQIKFDRVHTLTASSSNHCRVSI